MSISTELTRLQKAKTDIKAAIEAKGVTVPSNDRIDEYSTYISQISSGASLNIAYGDTAPSDTSKLWIKGSEAEGLVVSIKQLFTTLSTTLPTAANNMGTAAVGTKIYLFGGLSSSRLNTIQVFDTTNNTITTLSTTLPTAADGIGTAAVGTKIYLFGGNGDGYGRLNAIQVFDTTNDTITTLSTRLPTAANNMGTAAVGTKIYLFGGLSSSRLNTIQVFDTTNNTITTLSTTLPTAADGIGTAAVGTKIYLFGGNGDGYGRLNAIQVFDTTNDTITTLSTRLPTAANNMGTAAVGTKIYLFGGLSDSRLNTIQAFDTTNDTITTLPTTLPTGTNGMGTAAVGTKIYLFGGYYDGGYLNTINEFLSQFTLTANSVLITEGQQENVFNLLSSPTQVEISVKNVYRGDSSNVAQLNDAYLYNGSVWLNVNE